MINARPEVEKLKALKAELKTMKAEGISTTSNERYTQLRMAGGLIWQKEQEVDRAKKRVHQLISQEFGLSLWDLYDVAR